MLLKHNKKYWVLVDINHDDIFDKKDLEKLVEVFYKGVKNDDVANVHHLFTPCKTNKVQCSVVLPDWEIDQWVFRNPNEYLLYLVNHANNLNENMDGNISFDDFMTDKINESQKNFPEFWV